MTTRAQYKWVFLLLVLAQGLHSIEEYLGRLWDVFPPATLLTGLVSNNLEVGFLIINIGFFFFGMWCWAIPVLKEYKIANSLIWFWIIIEIVNGMGHPLWSLYRKAYVPGTATAPLLLILALYLSRLITSGVNPK